MTEPDRPDRPVPLSERIERSPVGQLVIGGTVALLLLATIGTHLPTSPLARSVGESSNQVVRALASEQSWGVFAPDPRSISIDLQAIVTFADGDQAVWTLPSGSRVVGNLRYYRWRKWLERVRSDDYRNLWDPTARWIASEYDDRESPVVRVDLVRFFRDNTIENPQPPYDSFTYYSLDLAGPLS